MDGLQLASKDSFSVQCLIVSLSIAAAFELISVKKGTALTKFEGPESDCTGWDPSTAAPIY
jgi:hypothetical protein